MKKKEDNAAKNEALKTVLTRDVLSGSCSTCKRAASDCVSEAGKWKCLGWMPSESKIADLLNEKS